jgi:hypothetical protein
MRAQQAAPAESVGSTPADPSARRVSPVFSYWQSGLRGQLESAAGAAPEGLAEAHPGPVGHRPLGLVQQRGRRANADHRLVGDTAAREHVDHLGWAGGSLDREASDARRDGLALPGRRGSAGWGEPDRHAAGGGLQPGALAEGDGEAGVAEFEHRLAVADSQRAMMSAGSAWTQGMWDAEGTACAWSHSSSIWVQPPVPPATTAAPPGLALERANSQASGTAAGAGPARPEAAARRDGCSSAGRRSGGVARAAAHELGVQVASLVAHQLAELGGQGQPAGGGERLADLADRELRRARW